MSTTSAPGGGEAIRYKGYKRIGASRRWLPRVALAIPSFLAILLAVHMLWPASTDRSPPTDERRVLSLTLPAPSMPIDPADGRLEFRTAPVSPTLPSDAEGAAPRSDAEISATEEGLPAEGTAEAPANAPAALSTTVLTVTTGDSLYLMFRRHGLSEGDLVTLLRSGPEAKRLARLQPGQEVVVDTTDDGRVERLRLAVGDGRQLDVSRDPVQGYRSRLQEMTETPPADSSEWAAPAGTPVAVTGDGVATAITGVGDPTSTSLVDAGSAGSSTVEEGPVEDPAATAQVAEDLLAGPAEPTPSLAATEAPPGLARRSIAVRNGDSLYSIFQRQGFSLGDISRLLDSGDEAKRLQRLRPGQMLDFYLDDGKSVGRLVYHLDESRALHLDRNGENGYRSELVEVPLDRQQVRAGGVIQHSLFGAGKQAGLSDRTIMQLTEIFAWDVDFALDIRVGDRFAIVYEQLLREGEAVRDGEILAAEFVNQGRTIRAVRFEQPDGYTAYYSPDGMGMRKAFIRTPLNYTRISSRFNPGRMHPILHRIQAHRGVDYAAPTGTPVWASGDGRVEFIGRKGGYGKTVILQHGKTYTTVYAHLSRYASGLRRGQTVRQGEVIGYVGMTGLATGPHLHYEFRVRGQHKDPLTVDLPESTPIPEDYRPDFLRHSRPLLAQLDLMSRLQMAQRGP